MITPGAATSGLSPSSDDGPRELNPASTSGVKLPAPNGTTLTVAPGFALTKSRNPRPLLLTTRNDGIVVPDVSIVNRLSPPAALPGASSLESLLKTMTARAPALAALFTFDAKVQFPRSIKATFPLREPAGSVPQARFC